MLKNLSKSYILQNFDRIILMILFDFEPWAIGKGDRRDYVIGIRNYLNSLHDINKKKVLELGSGLGDIIRYINAGKKLASDRHRGLLKANKLLSFFFNLGSRPNYKKIYLGKDVITGRFDIIVMTNFCQNIEPIILKQILHELLSSNLEKEGEVIIDTYFKATYVHNYISYFDDFNIRVKNIGQFEDRIVYSIKNK